jgi:hypothetical protein
LADTYATLKAAIGTALDTLELSVQTQIDGMRTAYAAAISASKFRGGEHTFDESAYIAAIETAFTDTLDAIETAVDGVDTDVEAEIDALAIANPE